MTRIDPNQLLRTMSVLLAPDGGIKSLDEVPRIVQLMHKFSKKLVSKCIYIHILRSSAPELLEQFLAKNGWELLNQWFFEAYSNGNLYLCGDLVRLFALCPMTGQRLKSDPKTNQAPRIMRQLSTDNRIEAEIRHLSTQVVNQWIRIARKKPLDDDYAATDEGVYGYSAQHDEDHVQEYDADHSEDYVPPVKIKKVEKKNKPVPVKKTQVKKEKKDVAAKNKTIKNSSLQKVKNVTEKTDHDSVDDLLDGTTSEESDSDDSSDELVIRQKQLAARKAAMEASRQNTNKKIVDLTNVNKSPISKSAKAKFEDREKEIRRRREAAAAKERRVERAKPYSRTELRRSDLESDEKEKIKQIAAQLKEQNKSKSKISGLGRIPKLPKKEVPVKTTDEGFGAMLGSLDTKPKPKPSLVKNKNRDLLETLTSKPRSKAEIEKEQKEKEKQIQEQMKENAKIEEKIKMEEEESQKKLEEEKRAEEEKVKEEEESKRKLEIKQENEKKEEREDKERKSKRERKISTSSNSSSNSDNEKKSSDRRKREKEKEEERRRRKHKEEKRRKEKEKEKEKERRDSNSSDKEKERSKDKKERVKDKPKEEKESSKSREERKGEKRSSTEEKLSTKKPKVIKESNMFGDVLSSIMKDDKQKTKKRKPSVTDNKAEKEKEQRQREQEKESEKKRDDSSLSRVEDSAAKAEERLSPIREEKGTEQESYIPTPKEKKGILVYARYNKTKRSIKWANDLNLVQVEYFDLDETERTNVFKQKLNFAERRKQENASEKNKMKYEGQTGSYNEFEEKQWKLTRLELDHPVEYGCESKEREAQIERESRVLTQLYFNDALISDPSEPDTMPKSDVEPKGIPQIDLASGGSTITDFVSNGWSSKPSSTSTFDTLLPPATVTKSPSIERSPPQMESSSINPSTVASTTSTDTRLPAPVTTKPAAPTNLHELLSSFKPGLLENIVNMANTMSNTSSGANNTDTINNVVSPNSYNVNNTHNNINHQQNKPISSPKGPPGTRPKFTLPPPVNHAAPRHFNGQHRPRDSHQNGPYRGGGPRVCNFFADFGKCAKGDNCNFAHISPGQRTH